MNSIAGVLNGNFSVDNTHLEAIKAQLTDNIQASLKMISAINQIQSNYSQIPVSMGSQPLNMFGGFTDESVKPNNIFVPKPIAHSNQKEHARIGRSKSMYVTEVQKKVDPEPSEEKEVVSEKVSDKNSESSDKKQLDDAANARKRMNVFRCPHTDRKHYAKNMCNNCYHKQGRNKKATNCPHKDRQNYAKGKCQNCYLNDYHKVKRRMKKQKALETADENQEIDRRISVETASSDDAKETKIQISSEN